MIQFLPNPGIARGGVDVSFTATCSVNQQPFGGIVRVTYNATPEVPEFDSLTSGVHDICKQPLTCEDLAVRVARQLKRGYAGFEVDVRVTSTNHVPAWCTAIPHLLPLEA